MSSLDLDDDLAALSEQLALTSSAAASVSDLDLAFQLQLSEAIQASLRTPHPNRSDSSSEPPSIEQSDAAYALALHESDLARAEQERRDAQACRAAHAAAVAAVRVASHDSLFARDLAAIPEDRWAHDGDHFARPLNDEGSSSPLFRVFFKGMMSKEVIGPRERDPGVAVVAAVVCGHQGEVVLSKHAPVEGFEGGREVLEGMALMEGLHAALALGVSNVEIVTDNRALHNHMLGIWHSTRKKVAAMINQVLSAQRRFEQCRILLVRRSHLSFVIKLARDAIDSEIAISVAVNAGKEKKETCNICLEDTDTSKMHTIEGCMHRFCFPCMKQHMEVKLLHGMLPACPHDGCTTKLSVEGSKMLLSPRLLGIMVQRIREEQIPLAQKIYCPYPKCSALMSLSEVIHPMQESSSKYTSSDVLTIRKCIKCRGSFCISCKVPWHENMACYEYKRRFPHARPEDAKLQTLARQQLWRQCIKCKHMIELAEGCYHMTCVCGYEFCYTCGKEWKDKKATCSCPLWDEHNIIRDDSEEDEDDYYDDEEDDYYDDEEDDDDFRQGLLLRFNR